MITEDSTTTDSNREGQTIYTVKMDSSLPYALVLKPGSREAEKYEGYYNARELHENMRDIFGAGAQRLSVTAFRQELGRRFTHTPEVAALLKRDGELLGQDLSKHFVYGSPNRPMNNLWADVHEAAVYIQVEKQTPGYHTYVAVPVLLDADIITRYELAFVSHG